MSIKLLVVVSDLHVGDTAALAPPGFRWGDEANPLQLNALQEWLWGRWSEFVGWVKDYCGDDPFALLVNGDATEGVHHGGKSVWSPHHSDHVNAAVTCLEPLADVAERIYMVDGTECHTRQGETSVGYALGAVTDPNTGRFSSRKWKLSIGGSSVHATHHTSTSARWYLQASKLSIHLGDEIMRFQHQPKPPNIILRAHCHTGGEYRSGRFLSITTPPWKGIDRHTIKVVPGADRDTIEVGGVILDWRDVEEGEAPATRWKTYYTPPSPEESL